MKELKPNIFSWSWWSDEKGYDFNGYFLVLGENRILIDPPPMTPSDREELIHHGLPTCILITNKDHVREALTLWNQGSCSILIHEKDADLIEIKADGTFHDGDRLPGGLLAVHIVNNKSPGETAFLLEQDQGVLFLGDALIGHPAGRLNLMKPEKYSDCALAKKGIRVLLEYSFDTVLVGDGVSFLTGGKQAIEAFINRVG